MQRCQVHMTTCMLVLVLMLMLRESHAHGVLTSPLMATRNERLIAKD